MKKCEVLQDTVIACQKGSIVMVSDKTYELARHKLKPVDEKKEEKVVVKEVETRVETDIETPETPKKKTRKK